MQTNGIENLRSTLTGDIFASSMHQNSGISIDKTDTQNNYYHINYHNVRIVSEKKDVD